MTGVHASVDCALGFANIRQKRLLAVEATPTSAVEQFGEIFEALFREIAPARDNLAALGDVQLRCHKSARKEETTRTQPERISRT